MTAERALDVLRSPRVAILLLVLIGFSFRYTLWLGQPAVLWPDSPAYYRFALRLADGWDFSQYPIFRTPLYPIFLSLFLRIGETIAVGRWIVLIQQLLGLSTVILFYLTALRVTSRGVAFIAALAFVLYPLQLYYEVVIQTEVLFGFFLWGGVHGVVCFLHGKRSWIGIASGILLGLATLTRPIGQLLPLLVLVTLIIADRSLWLSLKRSCVVLIPFLLVLAPWLVVNQIHQGYWGLSRELGLNMFHRVIDADRLKPKRKDVPRPMWGILKQYRHSSEVVYFTVWHHLRRMGYTELEADSLMLRTAIAGIRNEPLAYLRSTVEIWALYFWDMRESISVCAEGERTILCSGREVLPLQAFPREHPETPEFISRSIEYYFSHVHLPTGLIGVAALLALIRRAWCGGLQEKPYLFLALTMLYFSAITSLFNREEDRFRLPVEPIVILFAVDLFRGRLRESAESQPQPGQKPSQAGNRT